MQCYPEFPVRSGVHSWEEYLPVLSGNLERLLETYDGAAVAAVHWGELAIFHELP